MFFSASGIIISFIQLLSLNLQGVQYGNPVQYSITYCIYEFVIDQSEMGFLLSIS